MTPTKQQINQAEWLQVAGLCQESDKWMIEMKDGSFQTHVGNLKDWTFNPERGDYELCKRVVGPLPTFEEVIVLVIPLLSKNGLAFSIDSYACWLIEVETNFVKRQYHYDNHTPTTAAIEALLLLKGEG